MKIKRLPKIGILQKSKAFFKVAYGGRASGKSYGVATVMIARAICEKVKILCLKETQNSLSDSVLGILKRVIEDYKLGAFFKMTKHGLECVNGSVFSFKGLQFPDRIRSMDNYKYCWVEEAHGISKIAWEILYPTILRNDGAEIWVTFNPRFEDDPTYNMFVTNLNQSQSLFKTVMDNAEIESDRQYAEVVKIDYLDNRFLNKAILGLIEFDKQNDIEAYNHNWLGGLLVKSKDLVFADKYEISIFEAPAGIELHFGADWGFSKDPSTLIRFFILDRKLYIDYEAYGVGVEIDQLINFFKQVPQSDNYLIVGDSARPEIISHLKNKGYNIKSSRKGAGSIIEGVAYLRSYDKIVIHERCKKTISEFGLYKYKTSKLTGQILPDIIDKHNHCIDALRYATEPIRHNQIAKMEAPTKRFYA